MQHIGAVGDCGTSNSWREPRQVRAGLTATPPCPHGRPGCQSHAFSLEPVSEQQSVGIRNVVGVCVLCAAAALAIVQHRHVGRTIEAPTTNREAIINVA